MPRLLKWMVLSWWSQDFRRVLCVQSGILDWVNCSCFKSGNFAYSVQKPCWLGLVKAPANCFFFVGDAISKIVWWCLMGVCITKWCSYGLVLGIICGSTDRNAEFSWGYDGPMPQTREHILLSRQVGVFGTLNDVSQLSRWVDLPFWMAWRGIKSENFVGSGSINCIMMTCHATFVAQS